MVEPIEAAYFVPEGDDRYRPTEHTGGAWRDDEQHLAPVSGLVTHHMERWREANVDPSLAFARLSFEVLGQIPRDSVELSTEVVRPGRTIELVETTASIGGRAIIRARGWLLQTSDTADVAGEEFAPLPPLEEGVDARISDDWPGGFIRSVRCKRVGELRPGRGRAWMTSDLALVVGEPSTALADFVRLIDTANGVAVRESPERWMFPNVDLTIHFFRRPEGRWVGFDTRVAFGPGGLGLTSSVLHDLDGPVGTVQQALTLRRMA